MDEDETLAKRDPRRLGREKEVQNGSEMDIMIVETDKEKYCSIFKNKKTS